MTTGIAIHPYVLRGGHPLNSRHHSPDISGFLLRADGGYACLQPWEALGDPPISEHLLALSGGHRTALLERAFAAADEDAAARRQGISLFDGETIPLSHATLTGPVDAESLARWMAMGFTTFKAKLGPDWAKAWDGILEAASCYPDSRWRFDFNASMDANGFMKWTREIPVSLRSRIDFVEDPCPFSPCDWADLEEATGLQLAADQACADPHAENFIGICKPSRDDPSALLARARDIQRPMVVTSNMDHPLGVAWAALWAARFHRAGVLAGPCGLATHLLFEPDGFANALGPPGPVIQAPPGTGLGFDGLLESLKWSEPSPEGFHDGSSGQMIGEFKVSCSP